LTFHIAKGILIADGRIVHDAAFSHNNPVGKNSVGLGFRTFVRPVPNEGGYDSHGWSCQTSGREQSKVQTALQKPVLQ